MSDNDLREITFYDRLTVIGIGELLHDLGYRASFDKLVDAVRCCGEFPECSHVLAYTETVDLRAGSADNHETTR